MTTLRIERPRSIRSVLDGTSLLTVLLCFSIIVPSRFVFPPLGGVGRPDVLIGLGLLGWWVVAMLVPRLAPRGSNPLRWVVTFWLVVVLLSMVAAYSRKLSGLEFSGTQRALIAVLSNIGVILIASEGIRSRERLETLLRRLTYLGGVLAAVGSLQFFFRFDLTPYLAPPGFGLNLSLFGVDSRSIFNRVSGTSIHAIEYGSVLALILPLAVHFAVHAKTRTESHLRWALAGFIFLSGMYSVSRTNTIAVALVLLMVVALWTGRMRLNAIITGMASMVVIHAAIPGLLGTLKSLFRNIGNDPSIQGRTNDYPIAFEYIGERPVLGRGAGTWNTEEYFILDNDWLGTLIQTGWLGILAKALLLLVPFVMARHLLNTGRDNEWRHLAGVVAAQLVMAVVVGFFFDSGGFPQFRALQMVMIGVVGAMWRIDRRGDPRDFRPGARDDMLKMTKHRDGGRHPVAEPPVMVLDAPGGSPDPVRPDGRP